MFGFIKKLFGSTPAETVAEVPYKVEAVTPVAEKASEAVVKSIAQPAPKKKYYQKRKPAALKPGSNKPKPKPRAKPAG